MAHAYPDKLRVSVLIPTFNRATLVNECVEAVIDACRPEDEIIVLNDGSTDDTVEVLTRFKNRIQIISTQNQGKSAALNLGLRLCKGDYIWIVDDDDLVLPDSLTRLLSLLESRPDAGFVYGRHERFCCNPDGSRKMMGTGYWRYSTSPETFLSRTLDDMFAHQPGMIVRRDVYARTGPFRESLDRSIDYEMLIRLASVTTGVGTDDVVFLQRVHDDLRGCAKARLSEKERWEAWINNDRKIFLELYNRLPLSAYAEKPGRTSDLDWKRHALLRRGVVMARHRNWTHAESDFRAALDLIDRPLSKSEKHILSETSIRSMAVRKYSENLRSFFPLIRIARETRQPSFGSALARGLIWRVRSAVLKGEIRPAIGYGVAIWRLWASESLKARNSLEEDRAAERGR